MWIDGGHHTGPIGGRPLISPRDGSVLTTLAAADTRTLDHAVASARAAFERGTWSRATARQRGRVLRLWADLVEAERETLALLISLEMGKPISAALDVETRAAVSSLRWYGEIADKLMDESPRGVDGALALVTREPIGVLGMITPWNMPITLLTWKLAAALAAGNSLVVKPADQSPLSTLFLAELGTRAGLPDSVLQVLVGRGSVVGAAMGRHPDLDGLSFTGSTAVGKGLLSDAGASNAKQLWLELGGKTPVVVLPDADMDAAADAIAWGITFNSGQLCTATSRLIVHESVQEQLTVLVVDRIRAKVIGDPLESSTEIGPLASSTHRSDVLAHIERGLDDGAVLVSGSADPLNGPGWFLEPVVFTHVQPQMALAQDEIFGPVLSILSFRDTEQAIALANDSVYGLGSSVWTRDISQAVKISRCLDAGMVWVNCFEEGDMTVPFGGRKQSGHGADKSIHGLEKFTNLKTTWIQL
ncbi:aldehyde dehydrogenase family protein [Kineococcus rhizosphaerae]|uniref:Gamma-glutamyl-gamma-aminobutyraldehyde dehydrogenase n=1 Tax=Kineococcus rhizosphaerae TaxID=559628 RepID=A0A2T0QUU0_9ACTN|nr:gamma-glutamyl-gamma-aminobutyraldehyde dehydrogenase [Kineococcus rhizosphaerae]